MGTSVILCVYLEDFLFLIASGTTIPARAIALSTERVAKGATDTILPVLGFVMLSSGLLVSSGLLESSGLNEYAGLNDYSGLNESSGLRESAG